MFYVVNLLLPVHRSLIISVLLQVLTRSYILIFTKSIQPDLRHSPFISTECRQNTTDNHNNNKVCSKLHTSRYVVSYIPVFTTNQSKQMSQNAAMQFCKYQFCTYCSSKSTKHSNHFSERCYELIQFIKHSKAVTSGRQWAIYTYPEDLSSGDLIAPDDDLVRFVGTHSDVGTWNKYTHSNART